jgi:hypothetical protein
MRIMLAGAQSASHFRDLTHVAQYADQPPNLLFSYYYMRKMKHDVLTKLLSGLQALDACVLLDSGAHTFFSFHGESLYHRKHIGTQASGEVRDKDKDKAYIDPEQYMLQYIEFLKAYGHYFKAYAELDIDTVVGLPRVEEWREMMLDAGLMPMPVIHESYELHYCKLAGKLWTHKDGREIREREWKKLLARFPYVGVQGGLKDSTYNAFLRESDAAGVKVHGFAMTSKKVFRRFPFYSVDSTSWLAGQQYGVTYAVQGANLRTFDKKNKHRRRNYRPQCEKYNIDFELLLADDPYAINRFNAASWMEYQTIIDNQRRNDATVKLERGEMEAPEKIEGGSEESTEIALQGASEPLVIRDIDERAYIGRACALCYIAGNCPFFEEGAQCSVPFGIPENGEVDPIPMLRDILKMSWERFNFAIAVERVNGGMLDPEVSKERSQLLALLKDIRELTSVTQEKVTIIAEGPSGPGIISTLFSGYGRKGAAGPGQTLPEGPAPIDVEYDQE